MGIQELGRRTASSEIFWTGVGLALTLMACGLIAGGLVSISTPLVVAMVAAVLGCIAILCYPFIGILLFLTLLYLRPEQWFPQLAALRLPLLLSSFTLFAYLLRVMLRRETFRWHPLLGWMLLFGGAMSLSAFVVPAGRGLTDALMDAAKLVLMFVLIQQLIRTPDRATNTLHLFIALSVLLAYYAILGVVTGTSVLKDRGMNRAIVRIGDFDDPNDLAAALVMAVPLALHVLLKGRTWLLRGAGGLASLVLLAGVYLCNSRGGLLALGIGLAVVFIYHYGWLRGVGFGAALVLALALFGPSHFTHANLQTDDSAMGRVQAWAAGLRMMQRNPLLGVGYEQFEVRHEIPAHNSFIHGLGEGGMLTAVAWVGLNYWAILTLVRFRRREEDAARQAAAAIERGETPEPAPAKLLEPGYAVALMAGLLASLTAAMFLSHTYRPVPLIPVAFAAAFGTMAAATDRRWPDWLHYLLVLGLTIGGVVTFYAITSALL